MSKIEHTDITSTLIFFVTRLIFGVVMTAATILISETVHFLLGFSPYDTVYLLILAWCIVGIWLSKDESEKNSEKIDSPGENPPAAGAGQPDPARARRISTLPNCNHVWSSPSKAVGIDQNGKYQQSDTEMCRKCGIFRCDYDQWNTE